MKIEKLVKTISLIPTSRFIYKYDPYEILINYFKRHNKKDLYHYLDNNTYEYHDGIKKFNIYNDHKSSTYLMEFMPYSISPYYIYNYDTTLIVLEGMIKENIYSDINTENMLHPSYCSKITPKNHYILENQRFNSITLHIDIF